MADRRQRQRREWSWAIHVLQDVSMFFNQSPLPESAGRMTSSMISPLLRLAPQWSSVNSAIQAGDQAFSIWAFCIQVIVYVTSENTEFELKTTLIQNLHASAVDLAFLNRRNNHSERMMADLTFSFTFFLSEFLSVWFGTGKCQP